MAKYLVTGAAGFIGSNLVHALIARGEEVRGIDNFSHGRRENLVGITGKIEFLEADITDGETMQSACRGVDYVLHQAALGSVPRSIANPLASNHANAVGTLNVLDAARRCGVKRVVYASSSSIYGDTPTLPKHEDMPANPISPYAVSKYSGELYARSFSQVLGLETVSLRYFNVFGPRQHPTSEYAAVIPKFIRAMMNQEQPTIFGDGRQSRDFTYIENVVSANLLACKAPAERVNGKAFNVAAGERFSLLELYELLKDLTGFSKPALFAPSRTGDVRDSLADTSQATSAMGYKTLVDFKEGLRRTVEWYRAEFAASSAPATERDAIAH
ncbi:MAG TPA: SDR family oxidoreductase [Candidatus Acidoferrales bacterium]|nr:SDR family oxidoreductase [Candidatus Acidoferrales bacterium]